jgi:hypothetical protein
LRAVDALVTPEQTFIVSGYDQYLEQVQVLARFDNAGVELVVNQLICCKQVGNLDNIAVVPDLCLFVQNFLLW